MTALTETSPTLTEFAGKVKVFSCLIDGIAGTTGTLTVDEFSTILNVQITPAAAPTTDCRAFYVHGVSGNVITIGSIENDYTVNTQNAIDAYVAVIGY